MAPRSDAGDAAVTAAAWRASSSKLPSVWCSCMTLWLARLAMVDNYGNHKCDGRQSTLSVLFSRFAHFVDQLTHYTACLTNKLLTIVE
jgi:hypothetical protein